MNNDNNNNIKSQHCPIVPLNFHFFSLSLFIFVRFDSNSHLRRREEKNKEFKFEQYILRTPNNCYTKLYTLVICAI